MHDYFLQASNYTNNEKTPPESSLNLTLTQHPCDENPLRALYYHISPNFHTLMILLQVDPAFGDQPETVRKSFYETQNISIF